MKKTVLCIISALALCIVSTAQNSGRPLISKWDQDTGMYGFAEAGGSSLVIPARYESVVFNFYNGTACVVSGGKYYLINESGGELTKGYTWIGSFDSHGLCLANKGGKVDDSGEVLGGKYGYLDLTGKEIIPVKYNYVGEFNQEDVALYNEGGKVGKYGDFTGGKFGFLNSSGKILIKAKYSFVGLFGDNGLAWTNIGGKLNDAGECTGGKYGYVRITGEELVAPKYSNVGQFDDDGFCWVNKGGKIYTPKKKTENLISRKVKDATADEKDKKVIFEQQAKIEDEVLGTKWDVNGNRIVDGKYGMINDSGREIVPVKFKKISDSYTEGRAWVSMNGKQYGFVDENGRQITQLKYLEIRDFHNGVARVSVKAAKGNLREMGMINKSGTEITRPQYVTIGDMDDSGFTWAAVFGSDGYFKPKSSYIYSYNLRGRQIPYNFGFVSNLGVQLTPMKYSPGLSISNGVARCNINGDVGYVDSLGREITPFGLYEASSFHNNVAWVKVRKEDLPYNSKGSRIVVTGHTGKGDAVGAKYGLIGRDGVAITDFIFDKAHDPSEGLAMVIIDGKGAGWINTEGDYVIPLKYQGGGTFHNGVAYAKSSNKWGLIDKFNNVVLDFKYDNINIFQLDDVVCAQIGSNWGGVDLSGNVVVPFSLDSSDEVKEISKEMYIPHGYVPLTDRDVRKFKIRKLNLDKHFTIYGLIPEGCWDY